MDSFLAQIARTLYDKYGDEVSSLEIIFPSRRARLFFTDSLTRIVDRPIWQPHWASIDELVEEFSGMRSADKIRLVTELYKIYSHYHNESFDLFYFWGETLLSDFDSIDKYLLDPDQIFSNIADLRHLEDNSDYLTDEQRRIIARFWSSLGERADYSEQQKKFVEMWDTLGPIYHEFRAALEAKLLAYSGMAYRVAVEKILSGQIIEGPRKRYVIAGFNALSECEKVIFDYLSRTHDVDFFWDYDSYYVDNQEQEAGLFLRENLMRYPPKTPLPDDHNNFARAKNITVVAAPSDSAQCKYVTDFLRLHPEAGKETAIVLTDENLLIPVLHAIPLEVEAVNVTMGYPLKLTLEYSFTERLITLQSRKQERGGRTFFYHEDLLGLLTHPFVAEHETAARIAARQQVYIAVPEDLTEFSATALNRIGSGWQELADYLKTVISLSAGNRDFFNLILENIDKLCNSLTGCGVELAASTFASLLRRVLQSERIAYEGEPLEGVQVMGILETRNLDFENVLILSASDDTFPGNRAATASFIPHNLRMAYGLPTPQHHEGVYAYYFYRLLQRAHNVDISYSSRADERSSGEQSRYIYQLEYESPHEVAHRKLTVDVNLSSRSQIVVVKNAAMVENIRSYKISPTSFYNFIQCPLKFYLHSVLGLRASEDIAEEVSAPMFGNILHKAMELFYKGNNVETAVDRAIESEYYGGQTALMDHSGAIILAREIVLKYIRGSILPFDKRSGVVVEELEKRLETEFEGIKFTGIADRIDTLPDGKLRIVDYKTGPPNLEFKGLAALFSADPGDQNAAALQTFLYAMMLNGMTGRDVQPTLYYVRAMRAPDYSPLLIDREKGAPVTSYVDYRAEFKLLLREKLAQLTDIAQPFDQCADPRPCVWCNFNAICRR